MNGCVKTRTFLDLILFVLKQTAIEFYNNSKELKDSSKKVLPKKRLIKI